MNTKLVVLLGSVGALHMVVGGLFLASGCAKEDPPMPPGIYVPKSPANAPADPSASVTPETAYPATDTALYPTTVVEPAPQPKPVKPAPKKTTVSADTKGTAYVVKKGDSLWKIAKKNHITIENLALYNDLPANAKLRIGQKLLIPSAEKKVSAPAPQVIKAKAGKKASAKAASAKKAKTQAENKKAVSAKHKDLPADGVYVVKSGDNFSLIAKRHGLKVSDIAAANPGVDSSRLKVGQKLRLSGTAAAVTLPAKDPKPVVTTAPAAAESIENVPAQNVNTTDIDKMLDEVSKDPEDSTAPKMSSSDAAPNATDEAIKAVSTDGQDTALLDAEPYKVAEGDPTTYIIGEKGYTLTALCNDFHVNEAEVKKLNPSLPADGNLKPGTHVKMP